MMFFAIGRWPRHLSALRRFDERVDKIATCFRAWVVGVETHHLLRISSLEGSHGWVGL
jgi:hypothetical protein